MPFPRFRYPLNALLVFCVLSILVSSACCDEIDLKNKKILVVMGYHEDYPWHEETRVGIESVLSTAQLNYFYMDTKRNLADGEAKAKEAFELYQALKPDAVIAAEDNVQSMFVVPYLMNKVKTPVIFCGVNDDATKYGYPAKNVTGILEKKHYRESISLLQLISPMVKKIAVLYRETPSNRTNIAQLEKEAKLYKAEISEFVRIENEHQLVTALADLQLRADALLVLNLSGTPAKSGSPLSSEEVINLVNRYWGKPTLGVSAWEVEAGLLCAVAKLGQEQGAVAARMAVELMSGTDIELLPITQNRNGHRVINVGIAEQLGLKLKPIALIGAELVK